MHDAYHDNMVHIYMYTIVIVIVIDSTWAFHNGYVFIKGTVKGILKFTLFYRLSKPLLVLILRLKCYPYYSSIFLNKKGLDKAESASEIGFFQSFTSQNSP